MLSYVTEINSIQMKFSYITLMQYSHEFNKYKYVKGLVRHIFNSLL